MQSSSTIFQVWGRAGEGAFSSPQLQQEVLGKLVSFITLARFLKFINLKF